MASLIGTVGKVMVLCIGKAATASEWNQNPFASTQYAPLVSFYHIPVQSVPNWFSTSMLVCASVTRPELGGFREWPEPTGLAGWHLCPLKLMTCWHEIQESYGIWQKSNVFCSLISFPWDMMGHDGTWWDMMIVNNIDGTWWDTVNNVWDHKPSTLLTPWLLVFQQLLHCIVVSCQVYTIYTTYHATGFDSQSRAMLLVFFWDIRMSEHLGHKDVLLASTTKIFPPGPWANDCLDLLQGEPHELLHQTGRLGHKLTGPLGDQRLNRWTGTMRPETIS